MGSERSSSYIYEGSPTIRRRMLTSIVEASAQKAQRLIERPQRLTYRLCCGPHYIKDTTQKVPVSAAATASGYAIATKHLSIPRSRTIPETQSTILESLARNSW